MYCVYCGVKLQDSAEDCPLCHTPVMTDRRTETAFRPTYSDILPEKKSHGRVLLAGLLSAVLIAICLSCLIFCLRVYHAADWSGFVMTGAALIWVCLVLPFFFRRYRPMIFLPPDFVCLGGTLLYICAVTGGSWFLPFAFPVTVITGMLTLLGVALFRYIRQGRLRLLGLYLVLIGGSFMLVEFFQHITFGTPMFMWSLYCVSFFGALGLFLFVATLIPPLHAHLRKTFFF